MVARCIPPQGMRQKSLIFDMKTFRFAHIPAAQYRKRGGRPMIAPTTQWEDRAIFGCIRGVRDAAPYGDHSAGRSTDRRADVGIGPYNVIGRSRNIRVHKGRQGCRPLRRSFGRSIIPQTGRCGHRPLRTGAMQQSPRFSGNSEGRGDCHTSVRTGAE